ncbi:diacylglycerol kinase [Eikenella sp. NML03-A-027]|uniref:diacylglycerol kinase n=1 Tax=Eikenella sp. NML03-A-027 TaxID=1795828 RepID=UPI0007DF54EE|nr:diacylglycerol kinase [Eikenella sp. NML03-A-027]OAM32932.1 diacylglycerol kinase [Eikenella sp. NML03-A-027]
MKPGKRGLARLIAAAQYSCDGLAAAYHNEAAFRQLVWLHAMLLPLACCFDFDTPVRMLLVGASLLSLIVELFNTAIEAVVDRISEELHPLSKIAKDAGSAAQLVVLLLVSVFWLMALSTL